MTFELWLIYINSTRNCSMNIMSTSRNQLVVIWWHLQIYSVLRGIRVSIFMKYSKIFYSCLCFSFSILPCNQRERFDRLGLHMFITKCTFTCRNTLFTLSHTFTICSHAIEIYNLARVYVAGENDAAILGVHLGREVKRPVPLMYKGNPITVNQDNIMVISTMMKK